MKKIKGLKGGLTFGFAFLFFLTSSKATDNSIMEIINKERVGKLIAERWKNNSLSKTDGHRNLHEQSLRSRDYFQSNRGANEEGQEASVRNNTWRQGNEQRKYCSNRILPAEEKELVPRPNLTSLIADFTNVRVNRYLKAEGTPQVVTRKEYLRKGWCQTESILQTIHEDGCLTRTIINRFCYGQCNSFYIPKNSPKWKMKNRRMHFNGERSEEEEIGEMEVVKENAFFKSCGFCKPKLTSWVTVLLKCPNLVPPFRKKRIQRIKECKCLVEKLN